MTGGDALLRLVSCEAWSSISTVELPRILIAILLAFTALVPARAAFDQVPTFDELVTEAGSIVLTEVLETRSAWRQLGERRVIVTDVRLRVERSLKGRDDSVITVSLLGGFVGDVNQRVAGMPHFLVGDRDVLFLGARRTVVSPIVGMSHGRFRVVMGHNGTGRFVANAALQPILSVNNYARPERLAAGQRALALDDFLEQVTARVRR
jgi:hypothetical protein